MAFFDSVGIASSTGWGLSPLTWQELDAWNRCTCSECDVWELQLLRTMSENYASEAERAKKRDCPSPWVAEEKLAQNNRDAVDAKLRNLFGNFVPPTKKKK